MSRPAVSIARTLSVVLDGVRIAIDAICANVVRAALTVLGVAVGAFVVVVISAAIHGINAGVVQAIEAAGPNSFLVQRFPVALGITVCDGTDETCRWMRNPPITPAEVAMLRRLPSVSAAAATLTDQGSIAYHDRHLPGPQINGNSAEWVQVDGGDVSPGRSFTPAEDASGAPVVVINDKLATTLFGALDPIGRTIRIKDLPFLVIGVYHDPSGLLSGVDNPRAIVPLETLRRSLHGDLSGLTVTIRPRAAVPRDVAIDEVTVTLRGARGLKPGVDNTFSIATQDQLFDVYNKTVGMFFLVMLVLSAIGLIVGGVGVIAIMMISVTERTREIGVRKALGATRGVILWQFLVEAITLTGLGATIGLVTGWGAALVLRAATPIPASIPPWALLAAVAGSAVTGIVFGMAPALRAARLDPVEALRYE